MPVQFRRISLAPNSFDEGHSRSGTPHQQFALQRRIIRQSKQPTLRLHDLHALLPELCGRPIPDGIFGEVGVQAREPAVTNMTEFPVVFGWVAGGAGGAGQCGGFGAQIVPSKVVVSRVCERLGSISYRDWRHCYAGLEGPSTY